MNGDTWYVSGLNELDDSLDWTGQGELTELGKERSQATLDTSDVALNCCPVGAVASGSVLVLKLRRFG